MEFSHKSVLLNEVIEHLNIVPDGIYVDCTLGGAGHSKAIAERLSEKGMLIGIDKDTDALEVSQERLKGCKCKIECIHSDYKKFSEVLDELNIDKVNGVLIDLGVSSYQLDNRERGFSYLSENDLDMRMDRSQDFSAKNVINEYSQEKLTKIFYEYGEEKYSRRIAENIVKARPIHTTAELAAIIEASVPKKDRFRYGNPCKRVFQAIRIEVNEELDGLSEVITDMARRLKTGGRMCVITFHSLEDRIVKTAFNELKKDCICPPAQPICTCNKRQEIALINRKPITATEAELNDNSRASSAKLRVIEKID